MKTGTAKRNAVVELIHRPETHSPRRDKKQTTPQKVYLRAFEPEDYRTVNGFRQDDEIYRLTVGNRRFVSSERDRQWVLEKIANNLVEDYLAICLSENKQMVGYISLSNIDYRNSRADWSGLLIGKEHQRQGYGSQALFLLLEYAFDELGLNRVASSWLLENTVSLAIGKKLGFHQEGLLREYLYKGGRRRDVVLMSILKIDFERIRESFSANPVTARRSALPK